MICKKCGRAMIKVKQKDNYYYYKCPNCNYEYGKKDIKSDENTKTEES